MADTTATPVTKPAVIAHDETAYVAGFMAGNLGRVEACPYPPDDVRGLAWIAGRIEGAAKPHGTIPQLRPMKQPQP